MRDWMHKNHARLTKAMRPHAIRALDFLAIRLHRLSRRLRALEKALKSADEESSEPEPHEPPKSIPPGNSGLVP